MVEILESDEKIRREKMNMEELLSCYLFLCPFLIDDIIIPTHPKSIQTNLDWANETKEVTRTSDHAP
jgi:hypothetical protein